MKKYEFVNQDDIKDCGMSCLLMILRTYGGNVSKEYLRGLTNTTKDGTTAYDLLEAANTLGFASKGVKGDIKDLSSNLLPCIAHVIINKQYAHFIVIYKIDIKRNKIVIADPASGIKKITIDEFLSIATGNYLLFKPNKIMPYIKTNNKIKDIIITSFFKYKKIIFTIIYLSILYTLINIFTSYNFQIFIERAINYQSIPNLYNCFYALIILILIKTSTDYTRYMLFNYINHEISFALIKDLFSHLISLPYLYYKNRTTGQIITRISDLEEIKNQICNLFVALFIDLLLCTFVFISLFKISKTLALISIIIALLYALIIICIKPIIKILIKKGKSLSSSVNTCLIESLEGVDTVRGLNVKRQVIDKFETKYTKYLNNNFTINKVFTIEKLIKDIIGEIGLLTILMIGSKLVIENSLSLTSLITFNSLVIYFLEPIKNVLNMNTTYCEIKVSIDRINEIYEVDKENTETYDNKHVNKAIKGDIVIKGLNYSYGSKKVIHNLSLNIKNKDKVLLFGPSGCGKSTLAKLLLRYFDYDKGKIMIDSKEIKDYSLKDIREKIAYISQNELLFTDTIYNNIVLDRIISYDRFLEICKITKVDEIVKDNLLSYQMMLEENGFNLSGGQRQRIILARSLVENKDIYILDECLNQVDIKKEKEILTSLFEKYKHKTIIYISHRFNNKNLFTSIINFGKDIINA